MLRQKTNPAFDPGEEIKALGLDAGYVRFFRKALALNPKDRYQSVANFRRALLSALSPPTVLTIPPAPVTAIRPARPAGDSKAAFRDWLAREGARLGLDKPPSGPPPQVDED